MNNAQEESLDGYIGPQGIYFETISESESINLGIKLLYLERAISQDCAIFNQSLDKLYRTGLDNGAKQALVELIRALKTINDLCFNNQVKFGVFNPHALTHYFGSFGAVDAETFREAIQQKINANIATLTQGQAEHIAQAQKQTREQAEGDIQAQTGWRQILDLPLAQLELAQDIVPHFNPVQLEQLEAMPADPYQLLYNAGVTYAALAGIENRNILSVILLRAADVIQLIQHPDVVVTFADLAAVENQRNLVELLNNVPNVIRLIQHADVTFANIVAIENWDILNLILRTHHAPEVIRLIRLTQGSGVTLAHLVAVENRQNFAILLNNVPNVIRLFQQAGVTFANIVAIENWDILNLILAKAPKVIRLIQHAGVTFANIVAIENEDILNLILTKAPDVIRLIRLTQGSGVTLAHLVAVENQRNLAILLNNVPTVIRLIQHADVTFANIVAIENRAILNLILTKAPDVVRLIRLTQGSGVTLAHLVAAENQPNLAILLDNVQNVIQLIRHAGVTFANIVAIENRAILNLILTKALDVIRLIRSMKVNLDLLITLTVISLETVLNSPESEPTRKFFDLPRAAQILQIPGLQVATSIRIEVNLIDDYVDRMGHIDPIKAEQVRSSLNRLLTQPSSLEKVTLLVDSLRAVSRPGLSANWARITGFHERNGQELATAISEQLSQNSLSLS